jgi:hypothetical protein
MLDEHEVKETAEEIDQLVNLGLESGSFRKEGAIHKLLWDAARMKAGEPLTFLAAKGLLKVLKNGDSVVITTGFVLPRYMEYEPDGPVGAAVLARFFSLALGAVPVIVTDNTRIGKDVVIGACKGAGLHVYDLSKILKRIPRRIGVEGFPVDDDAARKMSNQILDMLQPSALIAIERPGRNEKGIYHSGGTGIDISPITGKTDFLIEEAKSRGIFTIGIGDHGNEAGMGKIIDAVKKYTVPKQCKCPCKSSMAAATETDVLVTASISNWGAYGIETCLAMLLDSPEMLHDGKSEAQMISECITHGGTSDRGLSEPSVDGVPARYHVYVVEMLNYLAKSRLLQKPRKEDTVEQTAKYVEWTKTDPPS